MADQDGPATNAQGVITSGKFAGQHVSSLAQYAENLERELSAPATPAHQPDQQEASPKERLEQHAGNRIGSVGDAASQRLEHDDEAEFSKELSEMGVNYSADWKQRIDAIKQGMNDQVRVAKGVHKMIYMQLRTQDPDAFAALHKTGEAPAPVEEPEEVEEPVATAAEVKEEIKATESVKPSPRAVSPGGVSPTPGTRATKKKEEVVPLQATSKVERLASEWGMSTEEYLKRVHDRGVTQGDIERESVSRADRPGRIKSVFDRGTATAER